MDIKKILGVLFVILIIIIFVFLINEKKLEIKLNGESEEYFFIGEYYDKGAKAYYGKNDISNNIILGGYVDNEHVGTYSVVYSIRYKNEEKSIIRKVHIIDLLITRNVNTNNKTINLLINNSDFDYVLLPNKEKVYQKNVNYQYNNENNLIFKIYLKNGLFKDYVVDINSLDNSGPTGKCVLNYYNNKTKIIIDANDENGISKYMYNGIEYKDNTFTIDGWIYNVTISAYDKMDNKTDIPCQAKYTMEFKDIVPNSEKSEYFNCKMDVSADNFELDNMIKAYGEKTRDAVAAAALYLTNYKYKIAYSWGGKHLEKGLNTNWGCRTSVVKDQCTKSLGGNTCELGLDCTGFTSWAFYQAGFDKSIIRTSSQSTGNWGNFDALKHRYSFRNNQDMVDLIKPGDIVHTEGHVGIVIGVSSDTLQVANEVGPIMVTIIKKSNGNSINSQHSFDNFVLFDDYFTMYGK